MCRESQIATPVFQLISDRRGGRTAWSSRVTINTKTISARYWYDGKNVNIMKEDAAECAVNWLLEISTSSTTANTTNAANSW
ncbi:hypothetical protein Golomagni_08304 [Golovinomyces magnicellulatus]|nr:hypothetical protein Golomagni_08304 [Golovinomyces magnicellulatus]